MTSDSQLTIPVMKQPYALMQTGPNSNHLASRALEPHPVDRMQRIRPSFPDHVRHVYGSALAMRLATEERIATQLESSLPHAGPSLYREIVMGQDIQMDFGDYLNLPDHRPEGPSVNLHQAMERQLGMW
jgi:Proteasome maturation factor UMP1